MSMTRYPRRRRSGFSLFDLLVVVVLLAAMLAIQIPTDAAARRTARQMQNSTQLRGIHQGLVTFANSNKNYFAGRDSRGNLVPDGDKTTGSSGRGDFVQARFWIMLDGDFFTPEYIISPSETAPIVVYDWGNDDVAAPVQWNRAVKHYSYAMLGIRASANDATQIADEAKGRGMEWAQTLNSQAVVLSDRNTGDDAKQKVNSIHTGEPGSWAGSVLWNDNHVGMEQHHDAYETKYGNGRLIVDEFGAGYDNLFAEDRDPDGKVGYSALMVTADHNIVNAGD